MPTLVYSPGEFMQLHGGPGVARKLDSRTTIFPDGAMIVLDDHAYAQNVEPPTDRLENLRARRRYFSLYAEAAERDFIALKKAILGLGPPIHWSDETARRYQASAGMSDEEAVEVLKRIRAIVIHERAALARIDALLTDIPDEREQRRKEQAREQLQRRIDAGEAARFLRVREAVELISLEPEPETETDNEQPSDQ